MEEERFKEEFSEVEVNVKKVLEQFPETRTNANLLVWAYWARYQDKNEIIANAMYLLSDKKIQYGLKNSESITRARRMLIQDGHITLTEAEKELMQRKNMDIVIMVRNRKAATPGSQ